MSRRHGHKEKMDEIRDILQTIAQGTLATALVAEASVAEAVRKAVVDKRSSTTDVVKIDSKAHLP